MKRICNTAASEPVTVSDEACEELHFQAEDIPPPWLSPAELVITYVKYSAVTESTAIVLSLISAKVKSGCEATNWL